MSARIDVEALVEIGRVVVEKRAEKLAQIELALRLKVPVDLVRATLAPDFDGGADAVVTARRWIGDRRRGLLVLHGRVGVGKSIAAALWAISTGALWVTAAEVSTWQLDAAERSRRWSEAPALVIDELGGQGSTGEREVARIAVVLAARWGADRTTLITTNLGRQTFARLFDDASEEQSRLVDRIRERGEWATIGGESRRGNPADVEAGRLRLERWQRIGRLVERLSSPSSRNDVDAAEHVEALRKLLAPTADQLRRARAALDQRARHNREKADALLQQWREEAENDAEAEGVNGSILAGLLRQGAG